MTTTSLLRHHSQSSCCSLLPPPTDVVPPPLLADKLADINKCKGVAGGGRISAGRLAAASVAVQGNIQQNQPNPSSACQHPFSGSSSPQSLTPSPPLELIAAPGRANDQSCSSTKQSKTLSTAMFSKSSRFSGVLSRKKCIFRLLRPRAALFLKAEIGILMADRRDSVEQNFILDHVKINL